MTENPLQPADALSEANPLKDKILEAIKDVYDPEIPVNIYELGLIYDIEVKDNNDVVISMTLTSPACPAAQELPVQVQRTVAKIPEVSDVEVNIVWDPPWSPDRMSEVAKVALGMM